MKRGLFKITVIILVIVLLIFSALITWFYILPKFTYGSETLNKNVSLEIIGEEGYTSWDSNNRLASVQIKRGDDNANIIGLGFYFLIDGKNVTHYVDEVLGTNSKKTYYVNLSNHLGDLDSVSVFPVFSDGEAGKIISNFKYNPITFDSNIKHRSSSGSTSGSSSGSTSGSSSGSGGSSNDDSNKDDNSNESEEVNNETDCVESWNCGSWGVCIGGYQTRTCSDLNNCGTENNKPTESQSCSIVIGNWNPPIGIPTPSFGIEENYRMYDEESNRNPELTYNQSSEGGYYTHYIDSSETCSDSGNDYGTIENPRCTLPWNLPEGSVVEIHNSANQNGFGEFGVYGVGTAEKPIFIRGIDLPRIIPSMDIGYYGNSRYIIIEGISFFSGSVLGRQDGTTFNNSYISVRNCDFHGDEDGGGFGMASWTDNSINNIVFYNNVVHDNGEWNPLTATGDQDNHGIGIGSDCSYIWIVDNEMYHNSGDGMQINAGNIGAQSTTHHIYVGRNKAHHNKQSGLWCKQAVDVIFSENEIYGHRSSSSSYGMGTGFQYAPENIWFLFNNIYDNEYGISLSSNSDMGFGTKSYFIGNMIHNIHFDPVYHNNGWGDYNPSSAWAQAGIMAAGGVERYFIGNTIYDTQAGINIAGSGYAYFENNIISNIAEGGGESHIWAEDEASNLVWEANNNLLYQSGGSGRIRHYNTVYNVSSLPSQYGVDNINSNPEFVNPSQNNFSLQSGSGAIGAGIESSVYQIFYDLYGINISKDIEGNSRPQGSGWDIGAYEYS